MRIHPDEWMRKLGIPQDVLLNTPILEIQEFNTIHVINYTGIAELTAEKVRITTRYGEYAIEGSHLIICEATHRELVIHGDIQSMEFIRKSVEEGR